MKSQREETLLQNQISDQKARLEARMRELAAEEYLQIDIISSLDNPSLFRPRRERVY